MTRLNKSPKKLLASVIATLTESPKTIEERVEAIPDKEILSPNMPIGIFLQEAYNIYCFAQTDRDRLVAGGFNWKIVEELPERIADLREAEAAWWEAKYGRTPVEEEYQEWLSLAETTREALLRDLEFAFAGDVEMKRRVKEIRKGSGEADFNEDLVIINAIVNDHAERLGEIGSDPALIGDIGQCARRMPELSAKYLIDRAEVSGKLGRRDRAYTFLAAAIEEIRRCARYVLRGDAKRLKGYASEYFRKSSRAKKQSADEGE